MKIFRLNVFAGVAVVLLGFAATIALERIAFGRHHVTVQATVAQQLNTVRAAVERSLNERIYLTLGLRAHVSANPDLTPQQFATFAAALMNEGDGIRSVTLIKDNVISDVYPRENNEAAIGVKLLDNDEQREGVLRAIKSRQPWLSAPIDLVQGGQAFINRAPVYVTPPGGKTGSGGYWGLVSILISKEVLLNDIVRELPDELTLAIRAQTAGSAEHVYFYGDSSIVAAQPITLDVSLATGDWEVMGTPTANWPTRAPSSWMLWSLGSLLSIGMGVLTTMLLQSNSNYREARATAESALVQLSRKNEDLEAFLSTASHDLRSPLRHIRAYSDIIMEDAGDRLTDEDHHRLSRISASADRMMNLLDSILRFARTGASGIEPEVFSLSEAAEIVVHQLPEEKLGLVKVGDLPEVFGDKNLLTQVLQNLIENGLKYNRNETIQVCVESHSLPAETQISVSDNGIGMNSAQLANVFKPGVRGVSESDFAGSGFGLAISERIVKAHGGKIWADSAPGKGSTFHLTLPRA
ncbi:ATP-binding protein [Planctomycetes bacterium K23_9]|uniref:histidine kinase n=1 Tax=Stieleria marina TaxID=1930275 RepID=A0A517NLX7_9BACT|nr:Phytochrome-like protein cph1 [Planctomycetes bacterium K23_9]